MVVGARATRWRWPGVVVAIAGAGAVVLGALGAHALRGQLSPQMLDVWRTAVRFEAWHTLALALCMYLRPTLSARLAAALFAAGIVLFCGSLYALVLGAPRAIGMLTPLGGMAFVAGWITLGVALYRKQEA